MWMNYSFAACFMFHFLTNGVSGCLGGSCTKEVKSWWKSIHRNTAGCKESCYYASAQQQGCQMEQTKVPITHYAVISFPLLHILFISIEYFEQVNNGSLLDYEKVYLIQGLVKFIGIYTPWV
jgi:hypothetical protein